MWIWIKTRRVNVRLLVKGCVCEAFTAVWTIELIRNYLSLIIFFKNQPLCRPTVPIQQSRSWAHPRPLHPNTAMYPPIWWRPIPTLRGSSTSARVLTISSCCFLERNESNRYNQLFNFSIRSFSKRILLITKHWITTNPILSELTLQLSNNF